MVAVVDPIRLFNIFWSLSVSVPGAVYAPRLWLLVCTAAARPFRIQVSTCSNFSPNAIARPLSRLWKLFDVWQTDRPHSLYSRQNHRRFAAVILPLLRRAVRSDRFLARALAVWAWSATKLNGMVMSINCAFKWNDECLPVAQCRPIDSLCST